MPSLQTLRSDEAAWLRHDVVAGLALAACCSRPVQDRLARGISQCRFASQWCFHGGLPHSTGLVFSST